MNRLTKPLIVLALSVCTLLLPISNLATRPETGAAQGGSTIHLIAIDAVPEGNTATSLAHIDPCARTEAGSQTAVDLVVDAVPADRPMIAFEIRVFYDPNVVEVVAVDNHQLLAANGSFQPIEPYGDTLPDTDGELVISIIDSASDVSTNSNMETGPGVLARITFQAKAAGSSDLKVGFDQSASLYPAVLDNKANAIGVDQIGAAALVVGQDCTSGQAEIPITDLPPIETILVGPTASPGASATANPDASPGASPSAPAGGTPTGTGGRPAVSGSPDPASTNPSTASNEGGSSDWVLPVVIGVLVAAGVAAASGAAWVFYRRRLP